MAYKLVCFDVDGTLIENVKFSWQLFHDYFEIDQKRREEGRKAFERGDLTYEQWAEHDVELWKERKVTKQDFSDAIAHHQAKLVRGARETLGELKGNRMKLAVISGSLNVMLEHFLPDYERLFDDVYLSRLLFNKKGIISGVDATQYDNEHKATALVVAIVDESFADAGGNQPTFTVGEAATLNKFFDTADFAGVAAGTVLVSAGVNLATKNVSVRPTW